ncbi:MAG: hypothetical protein N2037_10850 [Acidimicrobiales bacterium]|nr:hypothetical protein [Acidimicrobiales bacterium]
MEDECIHGLFPGTCSLCATGAPRSRVAKRLKPTTSPRSADDPIAPLSGDKDVSMPVFEVEPYLGTRTDWMPAISGYPHHLRPNGWLYLRCRGRLAARVRVPLLSWRDDRPTRTGDSPGTFGPGLIFAVDPSTWEPFEQSLGDDETRMRQGYRYHRTDQAGVVHHLIADQPLPEGDWGD